ncbi:MAG: hypothetical protein ACYDBV_02025 [Nitrospiria bacterium]
MTAAEIYQIEGFDAKKRYFNRNLFIHKKDKNFCAQFTYENFHCETPHFATPLEAVKDLVRTLQEKDFSQLRAKLNFKGKKYLTELEPWIEF